MVLSKADYDLLQSVHETMRLPAIARGLIKVSCEDDDEVSDETGANERPKTRSGRDVAWSAAELKTAQLHRQLVEQREIATAGVDIAQSGCAAGDGKGTEIQEDIVDHFPAAAGPGSGPRAVSPGSEYDSDDDIPDEVADEIPEDIPENL